MTKKIKYLVVLAIVFSLFQFSKFIKIRITNLDLPKGKIVFGSGLHGDDEIYTMNLNGAGLRRLTKYSIFGATFDTVKTDGAASLSPDDKNIIFLSDRDYNGPLRKFIYDYRGKNIGWESVHHFTEIYIMDTKGKNQVRLTYNQVGNFAPVFSPDGKKILFSVVSSTKTPFYEQIKIINLDGTGEKTIASGRLISRLAKFSPDSQKVFFIYRGDLYVVDINTGNLTRLTQFNSKNIETPDEVEGIPCIDDFTLSFDGKEITFAVKERKVLQFIFYSMNTDGSKMKELARLDNPDQRGYVGWIRGLRYNPSGEGIVFIGDFFTDQTFYLLDKNNNLNFIRNLKDVKIQEEGFVFTPDGKRIIFVKEFPYGLFNDWYAWVKSNIHNAVVDLGYYLFRRIFTVPFDNKYLCIMDIDGKNFRKIAKLPIGSEFGRDFIHWEK